MGRTTQEKQRRETVPNIRHGILYLLTRTDKQHNGRRRHFPGTPGHNLQDTSQLDHRGAPHCRYLWHVNRISASVHVRCLLLSGQSLDDISCFSRLGICLATGIHDGLHQQRRSNAPLGVALICRYRDRQSRVLGGPCAPTWLRLCLAKIHKENRFEGVRVHLGTSARGLAGTGGRLLLLHEAVAPQSGYRYKHLDGVLRHDSGYPRLGYPRESPTFLHISADYHEGQLHL